MYGGSEGGCADLLRGLGCNQQVRQERAARGRGGCAVVRVCVLSLVLVSDGLCGKRGGGCRCVGGCGVIGVYGV